jgi:lysophospholipase L1-like esterase
MKNGIKYFVAVLFLFVVCVSAYPSDSDLNFRLRDRTHSVRVQKSLWGTDIILDGKPVQNLSYDFPGENLFPKVEVMGNRFFITWIHYQKKNVQLCLYNSFKNETRLLTLSDFNFIGHTEIVFDINLQPKAVIFLANNSDNDDLFLYDLSSQKITNMTNTPASEKIFTVTDNNGTLSIKTETLDHRYSYLLDKKNLRPNLVEKLEIERIIPELPKAWDQTSINSIMGYGDSITAGKMRMNDLDGSSHPELAYLAKIEETFDADYGETYTINLGVGGASSYDAVQYMHGYFLNNRAYYCCVLFGTNDVGQGSFSADSSAESLEKVVLTARKTYGMYPIISTVPPQKLYLDGVQFYKDQTIALNQKIIAMAKKNNIAYVDSYQAFFDHSDGWEACLEDIKGNHPSPTGHEVMADLFKPVILSVPPGAPSNISMVSQSKNAVSLQWSENFEFDFSHCLIRFGFSADQLDRVTQATTNGFIFIDIPFNASFRKQVYFKIQAVDRDGNASAFTNQQMVEFGE